MMRSDSQPVHDNMTLCNSQTPFVVVSECRKATLSFMLNCCTPRRRRWRVCMGTQWKRKNEIGNRYGRLEVLTFQEVVNSSAAWKCRCDCSKEVTVRGSDLRAGKTLSCGCFNREMTRNMLLEHGHATRRCKSRTFLAWQEAKRRCFNPGRKNYPDYGGRGITMCASWERSFPKFLEDMGECPDGLSLDRRDNDGNYCKDNCRWATRMEQNNNSRNCHYIRFEGRSQSIAAWAREMSLPSRVLRWRIYAGWTIARAFTTRYLP